MNLFSFFNNSLKQLGLFSFLSAALLFGSCTRPENDLGEDLIPEGDLLSTNQSDTTSLLCTVINEDSVQTSNLSSVMLGRYFDPMLGEVESGFYTQLQLSTSNPNFPDDAIIDSVVLALVYDGAFYGKKGIQNVAVHELTEALSKDDTYYHNTNKTYDLRSLVKPGFETYPFNSDGLTIVGTDTVIHQLRIRLNESLGTHLFGADDNVYSSSENFQEFFKGVYVRTENDGQLGGISNFDLIDSDSKLSVYYRYNNNGTEDTTRYDFSITTESAYYSKLRFSRTGTSLQGISESGISGQEFSFVQAGGGLRTKIEFPFIQNLNTIENRSINQALLIIPFDDSNLFQAQPSLFLAYKDQDGEFRVLPDQVVGNIGGTGNFQADQYVFNVSLYVQRLINGEIESQGLYLVSRNSGVSVNRSVLHGPDFPSDLPSERMRLVLTYSY